VHFLGEVEDTGSLLRSIDLFTFSSFNEGVPNAVLEAMACGLAVAGTDYAGIREAIGDEGAVLLAPPRDAEALADRIVQAALDPELCARLGRAGQERVRAHFSIEAMCDRTVRLIRAQLPTRDEAPAR
jgi:glycosyltransferase involved in cell wall biosynthesis